MSQDFSKKMSIVLREDLASWQLTNTVGHIAAYLGNKMSEPFDTGSYFKSQDGVDLPRNSQFAVVALKASKDQLANLATAVRDTGMTWIVYTQDMIDLIDDEELSKKIGSTPSGELDILGVGIFGPKDQLKSLTGSLQLWK